MNLKNKKIKILIIILILLIVSFPVIALSSNNLTKIQKSTSLNVVDSYNIIKSLFKHQFNGGVIFQSSTSLFSYLGITVSSIFDEDIRNDMDSINWNIFNIDEKKVIDSQKVSFYKGVPVFKFTHNRSGSFLAIFISRKQEAINTLRHEFGHNIQQLILGPIKYGLCIGLPSWLEWSNKPYYDRSWEITADVFGGVTSRKHNNYDIIRGYEYLDVSAMFGILSYSFLPGEY